ncbi:MAG: radical SAM protein [Nanoarchaeota archaeon]
MFVSPTREWLRIKNFGDQPTGTQFLRVPPLAAATLKALTPPEFEFIFVDEQVDFLDFETNVDLVAVMCNTATAKRAYLIADKFSEKDIPVVIGGIHPTLNTAETIKHGTVVAGLAESVWKTILDDFSKGRIKKIYHGSECKFVIPDRTIFKNKPYYFTSLVETSRGCIHNCNFCSTASAFKGKYLAKDIDMVISEIKGLDSKFIAFIDDNIIANPEHAKKLFKALIPLKIKWGSQSTYLLGLNEELLELAAKSGCIGLFIGFESISDDTLRKHDKTFGKVELYRKAIKNLHKYGIMVLGSFIFGADSDNTKVFDSTFNFIQKNNIDGIFFGIYTPLPMTPTYTRLKAEHRITDTDWDNYDYRHCVFKPKEMTEKQLIDGISHIHKMFFRFDRILFRFVRSIGIMQKRGTLPIFLGYYSMVLSRIAMLKKLKQLS